MSDDLDGLLNKYISRQAVEAVRLTDAATIAAVGRWVNECGGSCGWVAASGQIALNRAGAHANELWLYRANAEQRDTVGIGDWVVRVSDDEFLAIKDKTFQAIYEPSQA